MGVSISYEDKYEESHGVLKLSTETGLKSLAYYIQEKEDPYDVYSVYTAGDRVYGLAGFCVYFGFPEVSYHGRPSELTHV